MKNSKYLFDVPDYKKVRVIIDTDAACEADDPFAVVHALLSPKLIVKGILAEHFNEEGSVNRSYNEIKTILQAMDCDVPVFMGQERPLNYENLKNRNDFVENISPASDFIIKESLKDNDKPLFILCQGAITNVHGNQFLLKKKYFCGKDCSTREAVHRRSEATRRMNVSEVRKA